MLAVLVMAADAPVLIGSHMPVVAFKANPMSQLSHFGALIEQLTQFAGQDAQTPAEVNTKVGLHFSHFVASRLQLSQFAGQGEHVLLGVDP